MTFFRKTCWPKEAKPVMGGEVEAWKRALDIICIVLALPVVVPVGLLVGLTIKLSSRGPVLFRQERIGYLGNPFPCFKFRTMKVNADTLAHQKYYEYLVESNVPMVKMDETGDERVIRFGGLIRSTGLDELPQLINVLRGEMSLVGPRPCMRYEFERHLPWQKHRFDTLPGLTGLWQVNGKNKTTFEEMVEMDMWYARNKSIRLDLLIMLKTIPAIWAQVKKMALKTRERRQVLGTNSPYTRLGH